VHTVRGGEGDALAAGQAVYDDVKKGAHEEPE